MSTEVSTQAVQSQRPPQHRIRGVLYMIAAMAALAGMGAFAKAAGRVGTGVFEMVFVRSVVVVLIAVIVARVRGESLVGQRRGSLVLRGVFGVGALVLFLIAVNQITLNDTIVLHKTNPLFIALVAPWLLREQTSRNLIVAIGLGLLGVIMIVKPGFEGGASLGGLAALGSALLSALAYMLVRSLTGTESESAIVFYLAMAGLLISGVVLTFGISMPSGVAMLYVVCMGLCAATGQYLLTHSYALTESAVASTASYSQVPIAAFVGWTVFSEIPDVASLVGTVLVVCACLIVAWTPKAERRT